MSRCRANNRPWTRLPWLLAAIALAAAGCQSAQIRAPGATGTSEGVGGSHAGGAPPSGSPGLMLPDAGAGDGPAPAPPAMACATEVHRAQKAPLDLLLLVDASDSMNELSGTQSKWQLTRNALRSFVEDPESQGLGVGLQFFPASELPLQQCQHDAECAAISPAGVARACRKSGWCFAPGLPVLTNRACAPGLVSPFNCPAGMQCLAQGRCADGGACVEGAPCAGGGACAISAGSCFVDGSGCTPSLYQRLAVPVEPLPGQAPALTAALAAREPDGLTPMGVASEAALSLLRARAASHPGRRSALVLATDGLPTGCRNTETIDNAVARLQQAAPAIPTYVLGVFALEDVATARPALERLAMAGATRTPFILTTGADLAQRLLDALKEIRGLAVACEYALPAAPAAAIDLGKVNVRTTTQGQSEDLGNVAGPDRCTDRGGWYYDPRPAAGVTPSRLVLCPASCAKLRNDTAAQVDLVFGCATRTID